MLASGTAAGGAAAKSLPLLFGEIPEPEGSPYLELSSDPLETPGQVRYLLYYDELTGLFNRRLFTRRLAEEAERAREEDLSLSLLWLNVDRFRDLNDEYGRLQGDHVLAQVGAVLRDLVGGDGIPSRFAGDEFVVLCPGADRDRGMRIARDLVDRVREQTIRLLDSPLSVKVTLSGGVASYPADVDDPDKLVEAAERASRQARRQGRDRLVAHAATATALFDPEELARRFPCPSMVGRERLLEDLEEVLQRRGADGLHTILVLQGNGGVGKTRLVEALTERVEARGCSTMVSASRPESVGQPFSSLIRALEDLITRDPRVLPILTGALEEAERTELGFLLPALARPLEPGELPPDPATSGGVPLRGAFVRMLSRLCHERPLLVVLDDAQWAERSSLQVLKFLWGRKVEGLDLCLVVNTDDPESGLDSDHHPLFEVVNEADAAGAIDMISVLPLGPAHVRTMVEAILPHPVGDDRLVEEIHRRSAGNPLLVEEILKYLVYNNRLRLVDGKLHSVDSDLGAIPEEQQILQARADALGEEFRSILAHAAALGRDFDLETLVDMEGGNEGYLRGVLEEAKRADLIRQGEDGESFQFSSERMRRSLYQGMQEAERQKVHHDIAAARQKAAGAQKSNLSELAYHLHKAGEADQARQVERELASLHKRCAPPTELDLLDTIEDPRLLASSANRSLTQEELHIAAEATRHLRMLFKGVRMYGLDHPQVVLSQSQLLLFVEQFLRTVPRMDLGEGRQTMLVNGQPLETAAQRVGRMDLVQTWNLQSLSFLRGLNISEIRALTEVLSVPPEEVQRVGGYSDLLSERGVSHIVLNERVFVEVGERDVLYKRASDEGMMLLKELRTNPELDDALSSLTGARDGYAAEAGMPVLQEGEDTTEISVEELKRLLAARREVAEWYEEISKYIDLQCLEALSADWAVLVSDLESGNKIKIAAACRAFVERGEDSVFHLTQLVARSNDARARKVALQLLRRIGSGVQERILEMIHESPSNDELAHLLGALDEYDVAEVGATLVAFVSHSVEVVRREALRILEKKDSIALEKEITRLLRRRGTPLEVQIDCILAAGHNRYRALIPRIQKLCQRTSVLFFEREPRLQVAACQALGAMGEARVARVLLGALSRNYLIWHTKPTQVRSAAALALARLTVEGALVTQVEKSLQRAAKDPDPTVRAAAKLALSQFRARALRGGEVLSEDEIFMTPSEEEHEAILVDELMTGRVPSAPEPAAAAPAAPAPPPAAPPPAAAPAAAAAMSQQQLDEALAREFLQPIQPASEGRP